MSDTDPALIVCDALVIQPGDKVLIGIERGFTLDEADEMREKLEQRFPGVEFTFVTASTITAYRERT